MALRLLSAKTVYRGVIIRLVFTNETFWLSQ